MWAELPITLRIITPVFIVPQHIAGEVYEATREGKLWTIKMFTSKSQQQL